jgi:hypothetical protein
LEHFGRDSITEVDQRVIKGMHGIFYVPNPEEVRAFIRDKLGFAHSYIGEGQADF